MSGNIWRCNEGEESLDLLLDFSSGISCSYCPFLNTSFMAGVVFNVLPESCFSKLLTSKVNASLQSCFTLDGTKASRGQGYAVGIWELASELTQSDSPSHDFSL